MRSGAWSVVIKLTHTALALTLTIVLARVLGPADYGTYAFVYALVTLLALPAMFGLPDLVVRETARANAEQQWATMQGVWRWSAAVAGALATLLLLMAGVVGYIVRKDFTSDEMETFAWGLLLIPLIAFGNLRGAGLRGIHKVLQGQLPEFVLRPLLLLVFVFAIFFVVGSLTPAAAMVSHVAAAAVTFAAGTWMLRRHRPVALRDGTLVPRYDSAAWIKSAIPLAFISGMRVVNDHTDVIMLGVLTTSDEVGVYRVVAQSASLVAIGLMAINLVIAPDVVRLHAKGNTAELQRIVTTCAQTIVVISIFPVVLFLVWGHDLLELVFGEPYGTGGGALAILAMGQLGNAAFGSVALLLNMTGHERDTARGVAYAAISNVLLNSVLIPTYGVNGAAAATATSLVLWNVILWRSVLRRLSINSSILPMKRILP